MSDDLLGAESEGVVVVEVLHPGRLYVAEHKHTRARFALRVPSEGDASDFARRAAALVVLPSHPNLLAVRQSGELPPDTPFLLHGLVSGETLRQRLKSGPLPEAEALDVAVALARYSSPSDGVLRMILDIRAQARVGAWSDVVRRLSFYCNPSRAVIDAIRLISR